MKTAVVVLAVIVAVAQAASVEKRESSTSSNGSYGSSAAGQQSGYAAPAPSGSYGPSQAAVPSSVYSADPYKAMAGPNAPAAGYQAPPSAYSYSDPAGYTMQQGFEGFMVPSFFSGSKLFAMIPWMIVAVGGVVLLALALPLVLSIGGLIIPGFSLAKLLKTKKVTDALIKGRMLDNPKLIDIANNVYTALEKFNELKKKAA